MLYLNILQNIETNTMIFITTVSVYDKYEKYILRLHLINRFWCLDVRCLCLRKIG